jgi:phenylpropionate dioxygenase-like ring-hydroxylating dioxygenase large terminal subunit
MAARVAAGPAGEPRFGLTTTAARPPAADTSRRVAAESAPSGRGTGIALVDRVASLRDTEVFNRRDRAVEGWYFALRSDELRVGAVKPVNLLGRELAVYRGADGVAQAVSAYCPHMGAHLAEGKVDGTSLRCFFHGWKFARSGACEDAPCMDRPPRAQVQPYPTAERYGLVWVWTGAEAAGPLPFVPELADHDTDVLCGNRFVKNCHPNVVLINAIDEHHFNTVHDLPVDLYMASDELGPTAQRFSNTTAMPDTSALTRLLGRLYAGPLTYSMSYHYGASGTVTLGPDALHFHILFALRPLDGGKTEGQTVLVTRRRRGLRGRAVNRVLLEATRLVGDYFARGDTQVFQTMKFDFQTPTRADHAIIDFIQHVERQPAIAWGSWAPVATAAHPQRGEPPAGRVHLEVVHG